MTCAALTSAEKDDADTVAKSRDCEDVYLVEGADDDQCDTYPVGVALYRRANVTDAGKPRKDMSKEDAEALVAGMCSLVDALSAHVAKYREMPF